MTDKPKGLSREFVLRSILKLFDEACDKKQWGTLECIVHFQKGEVKCVSPYFKPTIKEEVQSV